MARFNPPATDAEKQYMVLDTTTNSIAQKDQGDTYSGLAIFTREETANDAAKDMAKKRPGIKFQILELRRTFVVDGLREVEAK